MKKKATKIKMQTLASENYSKAVEVPVKIFLKEPNFLFPLMRKSLVKIAAFSLIIALNWAGLSAVIETFAYFNDTETSSVSLSAGTLDLTVRSGQGNFVPQDKVSNMKPGDTVARDIYIGKTTPSLALKHNVSFEFMGGDADLCDQLDLKIWYDHYNGPPSGGYGNRDMRLTYNGKLSALDKYTNTDFIIPHPDDLFDIDPSDGTEQWFYYSIILPSAVADSFQGEVCNFKFVFEAWQTNLSDSSQGFTDEEKLGNTIKVGYWNPPVVLNEFLPNAGNYPEFIEIYNKSDSPIDLQDYKIRVDNKPIPINPATTGRFSGGNTTIPAHGWLVVARPNPTAPGRDDVLDNNSGTIVLYDQNDIMMDSYTYGSPDHNINNTPGWTNNLVGYWPFDNDAQDLSGNTNNGINNGAIFDVGKINQALSFDGVNDYVEVSPVAGLDIIDAITMEAWVKLNSGGSDSWYDIIRRSKGYEISVQNAAQGIIEVALNDGSWHWYDSVSKINLDGTTWYHIATTWEKTTGKVKIYINGNLDVERNAISNFLQPSGNFWIGGASTAWSNYGLIDEVKIYNRALDATEILEHYSDVGPSGVVPSDKSYARIPDGDDNWVDPYPTPGAPNQLNKEEITEELTDELVEEPIEEIPVIEEESTEEEVITEENQEQGGIIEETNEIIDEVIDEIVDEIMPDEETGDEVVSEPEVPVIEDTSIIEEASGEMQETIINEPAVEEEPVVVTENPESNDSNPESNGDASTNEGGGDTTEAPVE